MKKVFLNILIFQEHIILFQLFFYLYSRFKQLTMDTKHIKNIFDFIIDLYMAHNIKNKK
jgi:hypothetical protein